MRSLTVLIAMEPALLIAAMGIARRMTSPKWLTALGPVIEDRARELNSMSDRLRIRDGLRGRRHVIEISPTTYKEIWNKLIEAGYDWLVWPDLGQIPMDGFVIRSADRGK